jgi:hypothetical protein
MKDFQRAIERATGKTWLRRTIERDVKEMGD